MQRKYKLKLVFDGRILTEFKNKSDSRSGIFFVAKNLLKEFSKNSNLQIDLYSNNREGSEILKEFLIRYFQTSDIGLIYAINDAGFFNKYYEKISMTRKFAKKNGDSISMLALIFPKLVLDILSKIESVFVKEDFKLVKDGHIIDSLDDETILFSPAYAFPSQFDKSTKFTVLHDVIPLVLNDYKNKFKGWFEDLSKTISNKDYYFTNSEYTKKDFLKFFDQIDKSKIFTTLLACDETFTKRAVIDVQKTKHKYNIPLEKKYIFSLSNLDDRKNMVRAIKTFIEFVDKNKINDLIFVVGGAKYEELLNKLYEMVPNFDNYKYLLTKVGYVDDEDLPALYSGAEWFTYTSQYEGFGLPPLEAMSCGCPVITSNNSSLPEVVGDAGIMIDWDSDEQHIQAYEKYYFDNAFRNEMAQKGLERAKQFSWSKCANQMIEVMEKYMESVR